jgi:NADPH-dependent curcumin reductase CurA
MKLELLGMNGKYEYDTETMPLADLSRLIVHSAHMRGMIDANDNDEWDKKMTELVAEYKRQKKLRGPLTVEMAKEPTTLPNEWPFNKAPRKEADAH